MQQSHHWSTRRVLHVNELLAVMALYAELGKDPSIQAHLHKQKQAGLLLLPSIHAYLVPADRCLHVLTAPDSLKHRFVPLLLFLLPLAEPFLLQSSARLFPGCFTCTSVLNAQARRSQNEPVPFPSGVHHQLPPGAGKSMLTPWLAV